MANDQEIKQWEKAMKEWLEDLIDWQLENPDKNWLEELTKEVSIQDADSGGERPPNPPKNP